MEQVKEIFSALLPVAGVIALLALAFVFVHVVKLLKELKRTIELSNDNIVPNANRVIDEVNTLMSDINKKMVTLDEPLEMVAKVSNSVSAVNDTANKAVSSVLQTANKGVGKMREGVAFVRDKVHRKDEEQ